MDSSILHLWRRLQTLTKLFRFVEIFILIILLSWISIRLPFAVKISGEYFRIFAALIFSPTSVFLLGNAIVVSLLAKSGLFSADDVSSSAVDAAVAELCRKLRSDSVDGEDSETTPFISPSHDRKEEVVFQDKEVIVCEAKVSVAVNFVDEKKTEKKGINYRRSKSEKIKSEFTKSEDTAKLRRSETDVCRKYVIRGGGDESTAKLIAEEEGECGEGGEEFRRTIEEFIAKQVRFHREESLAVVLHGKA